MHEERLGKQWTLWWGDAEVCSFGMRAEQGGMVNETLSASFTSVELSSIYLSIYLYYVCLMFFNHSEELRHYKYRT